MYLLFLQYIRKIIIFTLSVPKVIIKLNKNIDKTIFVFIILLLCINLLIFFGFVFGSLASFVLRTFQLSHKMSQTK